MADDFDDPLEDERAFPRYAAANPLARIARRRAEARSRGSIRPAGTLRVRRTPALRLTPPRPRAEPPPAPIEESPERATERHFVEFELVWPDGKPAQDLAYSLRDPAGAETQGTLGADGRVRRDDAAPGKWTVAIKAVDLVTWEKPRARPGDPVQIFARTSGIADGAAARVLIYREFREGKGEEVATLDAQVQRSGLEASWDCRPGARDGEDPAPEARFVAKVELEGGKVWAKTSKPLAVELPSIRQARWLDAPPRRGEAARLAVELGGLRDGTPAEIEIWRADDAGGSERVASLTGLAVSEGRLAASFLPQASESGAPSDALEHFFRVRIDGDSPLVAESDRTWWQD